MSLDTDVLKRSGFGWAVAALLATAPLPVLGEDSAVEDLRKLVIENEGIPGNERLVKTLRELLARAEGPPAEPLILSPEAGRPPLTVSITGPSRFADLLGSARGMGACLMDEAMKGRQTASALLIVNWGDGTTDSFELLERCPITVKHAYREAGTFPVMAKFYSRAGATDGREVEWKGKAEVRVEALRKPQEK